MPERLTRERLVEVQAEHAIEFLYDGEWVGCSCGDECPQTHAPEEWTDWHRAHLAAVLLALVTEHGAAVLGEAAEDYTNSVGGTKARPHARTWLRERAEQEAGR